MDFLFHKIRKYFWKMDIGEDSKSKQAEKKTFRLRGVLYLKYGIFFTRGQRG